MRSLISTSFIHLLKSIISRLATSKITNFWLVSVAEETGFSLALLETPKTGYTTRPCKNFAKNLSTGSKDLLNIKINTSMTLRLLYIGNQNIQ